MFFVFVGFLSGGIYAYTQLFRAGDNICSPRLPFRHENNFTGLIIRQLNNLPGELFPIARDE
jgi:hypothetical protein